MKNLIMSKPKIIITVEGGVVTTVYTNVPCDCMVIDYDVDGVPENELSRPVGELAVVGINEINIVDTIFVDGIWKENVK